MSNPDPMDLLYAGIAILLAITIHEAAHAWMAHTLGDDTAKRLGRLSLNPLVHLDPLGTILIVITLLSGFGIGWGKPVPVNPLALRHGPRVGMALVAAAGPLSNVLLAALCAAAFRLDLGLSPQAATLLEMIITLNVGLAIFNMIPIPPLDGFRVLTGTLPSPMAYPLLRFEPYGPVVLLLLLFVVPRYLGPNPIGVWRDLWLPPMQQMLRAIAG